MNKKTKVGVICDMHLSGHPHSPQYAFLIRAIERMREDGTDIVICLGDITGYGSMDAWELYQSAMKEFTHYEVLGNSDIRDGSTAQVLISKVSDVDFYIGKRHVLGINTIHARIEDRDRERLRTVKSGDIVFMHHYMKSMEEESGHYLQGVAESEEITVLHGHGHRVFDYYINKSRVIGMRGLDPDKAIGGFPSVYYLEVTDEDIETRECFLTLPGKYMESIKSWFGLSCVDNLRDVTYAMEHDIKYVELRCNGSGWKPDGELLPVINAWREKTSGYLSVHMPNLRYADGSFTGIEQWKTALNYSLKIGADGYTMHPPRVRKCDMPEGGAVWKEFLSLYLLVVNSVPKTVRLGIENIHKHRSEAEDETRGFGYTPEEISAWIDAVNEAVGMQRVGHILDVGHARNNGGFAQKYPVSSWYVTMGHKTVAYHIHQVISSEDRLVNHNAIENWFGPTINYTSFFYSWNNDMINHAPVFLEVKGCWNYESSIKAFGDILNDGESEEEITC